MWRVSILRGLRVGFLASVLRRLCVLRREHRAQGTVVAKRQGRPPGRSGKPPPHLGFPLDIVRAEPDITLKELAAALSQTEGLRVQLSSLHRALDRAGFSYKKRSDRN